MARFEEAVRTALKATGRYLAFGGNTRIQAQQIYEGAGITIDVASVVSVVPTAPGRGFPWQTKAHPQVC